MRLFSTLLIAFTLGSTSSLAQTVISSYKPGVTSEGAVYYLPKTAIRVTMQVEKSTYTPGEFCKYSEKFLRMKDVPASASTKYRILSIKQEPFEPTAETIRMPVRSKLHAEKPRNKNRLSDEQTQKQRKSKAKSENLVSEKSIQKETSVLSTVKPTERTIESDMKDSESKVSEEKKQIERIVTQTTEERNPRPIEQTEPQAPRIRKAIEQPVKRSIQPLIVKHMNG